MGEVCIGCSGNYREHKEGCHDLPSTQIRALAMVIRLGRTTCAILGDQLWHKGGRGNCSCPFARPAGAVIAKLRKRGLVERCSDSNEVLTFYRATTAGHRAAIAKRAKGGTTK